MEKTNWMVNFDSLNKEALQEERNSIAVCIAELEPVWRDNEIEVRELCAKHDYISDKIGPYAIVKFYMNGDESGELYTTELFDSEHYKRWHNGMKGHIEIFSETFC